ncbi:UPF0586 protein C9orf41 [Thelohanellus kitauei]|uniref:carnosine N-methyltransferase n=1 Tax=Thelohanellus kitauei TaxID=669202 RepID=A0A0C2MYW2_THEKT|nr:UPF0586 protein C9orf41 [Thelohanellus kitauei]
MIEREKLNDLNTYEDVAFSLCNYSRYAFAKMNSNISNFNRLPQNQRSHLVDLFLRRIHGTKKRIKINQILLNKIAEIFNSVSILFPPKYILTFNGLDAAHLDSLLSQIYREWSVEGTEERSRCFQPIIDEFCKIYDQKDRSGLRVLVPGSRLGRLVYELSKTGCHCVYNDADMLMIMTAFGFLNNLYGKGPYDIYPWINEWGNNYMNSTILNPVTVPDTFIEPGLKITMEVGNFLTCFRSENCESFDCIITCFFIDTAPNIIVFIEKIRYLLKNGGIWINLGHLSSSLEADGSCIDMDPTFEEIEHIMFKCMNFQKIKPNTDISCGYMDNKNVINKKKYVCPFFVVRKHV